MAEERKTWQFNVAKRSDSPQQEGEVNLPVEVDVEEKMIDTNVKRLQVTLGWEKTGDLDASAGLFDRHMSEIDSVWFTKLTSKCKSVNHTGDKKLTDDTEEKNENETITVDLYDVPFNVQHIVFFIHLYSTEASMSEIQNPFVRVKDAEDDHLDIFSSKLPSQNVCGLLMLQLTRHRHRWNLRKLGSPVTGRDISETIKAGENLELLHQAPGEPPVVRHVDVQVVSGQNLAAKNLPGIFTRSPLPDPYYVINFRDQNLKSEYKRQTIDPEWTPTVFELGSIIAAEPTPMEIELFDYNFLGKHARLGKVTIEAGALFQMGLGQHRIHRKLEGKIEDQISGSILLHVDVIEEAAMDTI